MSAPPPPPTPTTTNEIPANYGGIVTEPNMNDVLSGRGGRINAHPGNVQYRGLVKHYRVIYMSPVTKKLDKAKIAANIVTIVRNMNPPGRFLKEENGAWVEIGDERATKKAGQAMREKEPETKKNAASASSGSGSGSGLATGGMAEDRNHTLNQIDTLNYQQVYPDMYGAMMNAPQSQPSPPPAHHQFNYGNHNHHSEVYDTNKNISSARSCYNPRRDR